MSRDAVLTATAQEVRVHRDLHDRAPTAWQALLDWCLSHGLDPHRMPADNHIVRDVERCRVVYDEFVFIEGSKVLDVVQDEGSEFLTYERRRCFVQGETPPAPWPPEVTDVDQPLEIP